MSRPRRSAVNSVPSVTVARPPSLSPEDSKKSIRLTVKMPASKLREATSGHRKSIAVNSRDTFEPGEILSGPRGSRAKRPIVEDTGSEEDEEDEEEEEEEEEGEGEEEGEEEGEDNVDEEEEEEDGMDEDAEGESEDVDAEGDVDLEGAAPPPPPPVMIAKPILTSSKPTFTITPAKGGKVKSVEAKEMEMEDEEDDEELSELESDEEGEEGGGEGVEPGEEDVEGEEEPEEEDEDEEADSDDETPAAGSRASTPDLSKLTKRQRSRLDEVMSGELLELPAESKVKKHLTAEEHAMRRAEMARRRKNLSEKRNEEEKMDTINKLLKKQAPKRRGRALPSELNLNGDPATPNGTLDPEQQQYERPRATFVRWVSNREGCRVGVPEEWLGTPVGRVFGKPRGGRMVEEMESRG
ncbi:MAG: hypothetical protein M1827_005086 [Pycnora praestabilis]|nr:MAG: hypothetical protein M1827_005086 [Pycnora praestabilis]